MYEGKVFSMPGSGLWVKGPSSTPRFSMWSKSFAYRFRFFLPAIPVPAPEGSHSFLIHSAHLCRSKSIDIHNHYTFSDQIKHMEKTEAVTHHQLFRCFSSIQKFKAKQTKKPQTTEPKEKNG